MRKGVSVLAITLAATALSGCGATETTVVTTTVSEVSPVRVAPRVRPTVKPTVKPTARPSSATTPAKKTRTATPEMPDLKNGIDREGTKCKPEYMNANGLCSPWIEKQVKDERRQRRCKSRGMSWINGTCMGVPYSEQKARCKNMGGTWRRKSCEWPTGPRKETAPLDGIGDDMSDPRNWRDSSGSSGEWRKCPNGSLTLDPAYC